MFPAILYSANVNDNQKMIERWVLEVVHRHPVALRLLRAVHAQLLGLLQYVTLIFGSANHHAPVPPSDNCITTANTIFHLLRLRKVGLDKTRATVASIADEMDRELEEGRLWNKARMLLKDCTDVDTLTQITNDEGYNILLIAVLQADFDVLQLLLSEGSDMNQSKCTLPLHLACKVGNKELVEFLVEHGARVDKEAGMCHPYPHIPVKHVPSRFHFLETDIYKCDSNHKLPLLHAIQQDHVNIVRFLLEYDGRPRENWPFHHYPLHYACKKGSFHCMEYLTSVWSRELNAVDAGGMRPLHHAVQWGKDFVKFLVESGANVHTETNKHQGALHVLYNNIRDPLQLYSTTKYLLGTGMEQDVSRRDSMDETPMHSLVVLVDRKVEAFKKEALADPERQAEFDRQIVKTLDLLLTFNCDPNIENSVGLTALQKHVLLVDYTLNNDPCDNTLAVWPVRSEYNLNFPLICQTLESLLHHGSNPNRPTPAGWTPTLIFLQSTLKLDSTRFEDQGRGVLECLRVLCRNGAQPSLTPSSHINTVSMLSRLGMRCLSLRDDNQRQHMSDLYKEILATLLQSGFQCNHIVKHKPKREDHVSGNILVEVVKLAQLVREPSHLLYIYDWVLTLLQWGTDPDIEPYPSDHIICHSQSSIFLKPKGSQPVNQYISEIQDINSILDGGYAEKLLMLFCNTMGHDALYQCLGTAKFMSRFDPNSAPTGKFLKLISRLSSQPRSLRQISRVAISKALNRKLRNVYQLPLPVPLQNYILNVE